VIIILLCWAAVIGILLAVVLAMARAESHSDALSSRIPDGFEWHQRRIREAEKKRGTNRVVAPGLALTPAARVRPGSTADPASSYWQGASQPVVSTSHSVVEVHAFGQPRSGAPEQNPADSQDLRTKTAQRQTPVPVPVPSSAPSAPTPHRRVTVRTSPSVVPAWTPSAHPDRRTTEEKAQSPALANLVSRTEQESARRDMNKANRTNGTNETDEAHHETEGR
jgi:hypothetical protein